MQRGRDGEINTHTTFKAHKEENALHESVFARCNSDGFRDPYDTPNCTLMASGGRVTTKEIWSRVWLS